MQGLVMITKITLVYLLGLTALVGACGLLANRIMKRYQFK
jgi:nitrate reductase gamma subunit